MALDYQSMTRDFMLLIGEVRAVRNATGGKGDPEILRYDLFLRSVLNPSMVLNLTNHLVKRPTFKNVEVNAPTVGDPVFAIQTPKGIYVHVFEQLEFTENCA